MKKAFKLFKECAKKEIFNDNCFLRLWDDESGSIWDIRENDEYFSFNDIAELKTFLKDKLAEYDDNSEKVIPNEIGEATKKPFSLFEKVLEKERKRFKEEVHEYDKMIWELLMKGMSGEQLDGSGILDHISKTPEPKPLNKEMFDNWPYIQKELDKIKKEVESFDWESHFLGKNPIAKEKKQPDNSELISSFIAFLESILTSYCLRADVINKCNDKIQELNGLKANS